MRVLLISFSSATVHNQVAGRRRVLEFLQFRCQGLQFRAQGRAVVLFTVAPWRLRGSRISDRFDGRRFRTVSGLGLVGRGKQLIHRFHALLQLVDLLRVRANS